MMLTPRPLNSLIKTSLSVFKTSYPVLSRRFASNSNSRLDGDRTVTSKSLALKSRNALTMVGSSSKFDRTMIGLPC